MNTTTAVSATPALNPKPTYVNAFHWIAGLQAAGQEESGSTTLSDINPNTISLLLWVWKYTNSQEGRPEFGKAWASHETLAKEMHVSLKTVQRAFDDAWSWGLISREHLFKKNGKITVSTAPLTRKNTGLGEFQHTRYWLNWDFIRELQPIGLVTESTPNGGHVENGVVKESSPNEIGVVRESTAVVTESTDVLNYGFIFAPTSTLDCDGTAPDALPSRAVSSSEAEAGTAREMSGTRQIQNLVVVAAGTGEKSQVKCWGIAPEASQGLRPDTLLGEFPPRPSSFESQKRAQGNQEERTEQIIAAARQRQFDRKKSQAEIIREYEAVFNRVAAEAGKPYSKGQRDITLESGSVFRTNATHRKAAAELYRAVGGDAALSAWERFLANDDHTATEAEWTPYSPCGDDPEKGRWTGTEVQRTWLLRDFIEKYGEELRPNEAA